MGIRLAHKEKKLLGFFNNLLAERLIGIKIIAQIGNGEGRKVGFMLLEPPFRGGAFTILLFMPILGHDQLRR